MKTNREHGNALIYVLIAIALFGALSMIMSRQGDTGEAGELPSQKAELYATEIGSYAAQAKSAVDQMLFSGGRIENLDFMLPGAGFDAGSSTDKIRRVYHPDGGGLIPGRLPEEAISYEGTGPVAGWYMGRFNNVEWTESTDTDVILTAYGIRREICEKLNEKLTGAATIPTLGIGAAAVLVDDQYHVNGSNADFTTVTPGTPVCADCNKRASLCVKDQSSDIYAFYTVIADH